MKFWLNVVEGAEDAGVKHHVERAARRAGLGEKGVHRLRDTFCSHLAMRGAPARAIQELAGHKDLTTTQRYMHLSPAANRGGDPATRPAGWRGTFWRHIGDGGSVIRYRQSAV
jgi:hypothetical protein